MAWLLSTIIGFWSKLRRGVRRHGIFGFFKVVAEKAAGLTSRWRPSVRAEILKGEQRSRDFDQRFGVDTAGYIHPTKFALKHPNQVHAVSYGASDPQDFRTAIASLPIDYPDFVFVDFGSGKGRAILLASEFPFKRVVGVEFSEELDRIARENINHFSKKGCPRTKVELICMDAVDYTLPDSDLVCYFCNPFDETLMTQIVANIRRSLLRQPREVFILYYNAKEGHVFDRADCFERVETSGWIRMWRTPPESKRAKQRARFITRGTLGLQAS